MEAAYIDVGHRLQQHHPLVCPFTALHFLDVRNLFFTALHFLDVRNLFPDVRNLFPRVSFPGCPQLVRVSSSATCFLGNLFPFPQLVFLGVHELLLLDVPNLVFKLVDVLCS